MNDMNTETNVSEEKAQVEAASEEVESTPSIDARDLEIEALRENLAVMKREMKRTLEALQASNNEQRLAEEARNAAIEARDAAIKEREDRALDEEMRARSGRSEVSDVKKLIARYGAACAATARAGIDPRNLPRIEVDHEVLRDCERAELAAGAALEAEVARLREEEK